MNQRWIDDLWFSVENYDTGSSNRLGMLARLHDLDAARAAYDACRTQYPKKLLYLCQGGRDPTAERRGFRCDFRYCRVIFGTTSKRAHLSL